MYEKKNLPLKPTKGTSHEWLQSLRKNPFLFFSVNVVRHAVCLFYSLWTEISLLSLQI